MDTGPTHAKCLVVFMPGRGDADADFDKEKFVSLVRARDLSVDMVAANATIGYYANGIVSDRVEQDVVAPLDPAKYEKVWMIGISMGGVGTLMYSYEHPTRLKGVLLMAPFLGDDDVANDVKAAGGLDKWTAPAPATLTEDNYQRQVWGYLQRTVGKKEPGPDVYLAYGNKDNRVGHNAAILAASMPADRLFTTDGGHDWGPWRNLLDQFLDRSSLASDCKR
jgi:pimeloyl-ACP methyl ester carboxylesterase